MKNALKTFTLALVVLMLFAQCKTSKGKVNMKKPDDVAIAFFKSFSQLDMTTAKAYSTKETGEMLSMLEAALAMAGPEEIENAKKEATEQSKNIKTATCNTTGNDSECTLCCGPNGEKMDGAKLKLKKVDGKWLVHLSKEDMMGGGELDEEIDEN